MLWVVQSRFDNQGAEQSVKCLAADTSDCRSRVREFDPSPSHTFVDIDHEIISVTIPVPSADSRRVVSYKPKYVQEELLSQACPGGAQWLSGRVFDSRPRGCGCEPYQHQFVVSLSKNINHDLVLVQPRKTRPFITERLLRGRKDSNQTNKTSLPRKKSGYWLGKLTVPTCQTIAVGWNIKQQTKPKKVNLL